MTYAKLIGFGLLVAAVLALLKFWFFTSFTWTDSTSLHIVYWIVVAVLAAAFSRRLGVITVLEAVVVLVLWFVFALIFDVAFVGPFAGWVALIDPAFLSGYVVLALSVLAFHKKRHVHRRNAEASK